MTSLNELYLGQHIYTCILEKLQRSVVQLSRRLASLKSIEGSPETPRTSQPYGVEGFKGAPQTAPSPTFRQPTYILPVWYTAITEFFGHSFRLPINSFVIRKITNENSRGPIHYRLPRIPKRPSETRQKIQKTIIENDLYTGHTIGKRLPQKFPHGIGCSLNPNSGDPVLILPPPKMSPTHASPVEICTIFVASIQGIRNRGNIS